jgi:hypothetical protein
MMGSSKWTNVSGERDRTPSGWRVILFLAVCVVVGLTVGVLVPTGEERRTERRIERCTEQMESANPPPGPGNARYLCADVYGD